MQHLSTSRRPSIACVDLDQLTQNLQAVREFVGTNVACMAMVKADAYGHGAVACGRALESAGTDWLGVALPEEGFELRRAGIECPILCLGSFWPGQENALIETRVTPVVCDDRAASLLNSAARDRGMAVDIHVKIDTGMSRLGIDRQYAADFAHRLNSLSNLRVSGLLSHFAAADDPAQEAFTELQMERFDEACTEFRDAGHDPELVDIANSAAAVALPSARRNLVRIGGALYGLLEDVLPAEVPQPSLRGVLSLKSRVAALRKIAPGDSIGYGRTYVSQRDSVIALVPIGYGDGYPRALSNTGNAIIRGRRVPIVGRISMDWMTVDVTDIPEAAVDDEIILIGGDGDNKISAADLARQLGTISYEITCSISPRVPRIYVGSGSSTV